MKNLMKIVFSLIASILLTWDLHAQYNVVVVVADDLGLEVGCYGDNTARTPNIDQFAAEGVRFVNGHVTQASCSPSRSSILTGLYPHVNGQVGLANHDFHMNENYPTFANLLNNNNYYTGIVGKLHVNGANGSDNYIMNAFDFQASSSRDTKKKSYMTSRLNSFFNNVGDKNFLLYCNFSDPHTPLLDQVEGIPANPFSTSDVEEMWFQHVDDQEELARIRSYYNSVTRLDYLFGMLLNKLKSEGKADNTIIFFMGDHGAPFDRAKGACYNASLHVPFLVRWPGGANGRSVTELVSTVDILPTIMEVTGVKGPNNLPGRSLVPLLQNKPTDWPEYVFGEFTNHTGGKYYPRRSIRNAQYQLIVTLKGKGGPNPGSNPLVSIDGDKAYKIVQDKNFPSYVENTFSRFRNPDYIELYDIRNDPGMFFNIAEDSDHEAIKEKLFRKLQCWSLSTKDKLFDAFDFDPNVDCDDNNNPVADQRAYVEHSLPGTIEAEHYDQGGEGVAFHDLDQGNNHGCGREDAVDLQATTDAGGGCNLGWTRDGEWLEYTLQDVQAGSYDITLRVASATTATGRLTLKLAGKTLGSVEVSSTGGWQTFLNKQLSAVALAAGKNQVLRLEISGGGMNINWMRFTKVATPAPVGGTLLPIADAYVRGNGEQDGSGEALLIKQGGSSSYERVSYLKFDLSGYTSAQISSATLRLYCTELQDESTRATVAVHGSADNWTEQGITWQNKPALGNRLGSSVVDRVGRYYAFNVSQYVQGQAAGDKTVSLALVDGGAVNKALYFGSRESGNPPELVITTTNARQTNGDKAALALEEAAVQLYPNPATGIVTVSGVEGKVGVYNLQGIKVAEVFAIEGRATVDLSGKAGLYLFKTKEATYRVIIE